MIKSHGWRLAVATLCALAAGAACKTGPSPSSRAFDQAQAGDETSKRDFRASDLSILFPLKGVAQTDSDDPFQMQGTGFCNAPGLGLGGDNPLFDKELFEQFTDETFGVIPGVEWPAYLTAPESSLFPKQLEKRRNYSLEPSEIEQVNEEVEQYAGLVTQKYEGSGSEDLEDYRFCRVPLVPSGLRDLNDEELLELQTNLALIRGLDNRVCNYENWRIVGIRFDPCLARAETAGFYESEGTSGLPSACEDGVQELRLVAQPFVKDARGTWTSMDLAMHLLYDYPGTEEVLRELRKIATVTDATLSEAPPWPKAGFTEEGVQNPRLLTAHPGLRAEMNRCDGPVAQSVKEFLLRFATQDKMNGIAWMSVSTGLGQWSFGAQSIRNGEFVGERTEVYTSFSESVFGQYENGSDQIPFAIPGSAHASLESFYEAPFRRETLGTPYVPEVAERAREAADTLNAIADPTRISQVPSDQKNFGSNCVSCHMIGQTLTMLRGHMNERDFHGPNPYEGGFRGRELSPDTSRTPPVWDPFTRRQRINLHNFGYGPSFGFGVSRRTINETAELMDIAAHYYPNIKP